MNLLLLACVPVGDSAAPAVDTAPAPEETAAPARPPFPVTVRVLLDGAPVAGATVMQGGSYTRTTSAADGTATITMDPSIVGDQYVVASHPDARIEGVEVDEPTDAVPDIELVSFDRTDNPAYVFRDPGPEGHENTDNSQCGHCHLTIHHEWYESPHRTAASNPVVHDVYQGIAQYLGEEDCAAGNWAEAIQPGTGGAVDACHVAEPVTAPGCADCHAPGIDGQLGGRDLLEATGRAYDYGVHCDVCHRTEAVVEGAPAGVAGWLKLHRPNEPAENPAFGEWTPLTFGPFEDVLNPYMGSVARSHFHEAALCGGCHEAEQAVLVEGTSIDLLRWPAGTLPIHSTYSEWVDGPMNPSAPCQSCHMPPKPEVGNSADLYNEFDEVFIGVSAGWPRTPGEVRAHAWWGPRQPEAGMLRLAAAVDLDVTLDGTSLTVRATTSNVGPGHAIPTGEPLRNLVLAVEATCDGVALDFAGGHVVSDVGGAVAARRAPEDLGTWPPGTVRFFRQVGWVDYAGHGPFGDGSFTVADKGLPELEFLAERAVVDGAVEVPEGAELAWFVEAAPFPVDGGTAAPLAGTPGFDFAKVLVGADGARMVPHHLAVDVARDNRILPASSFSTEHRFVATCATPSVRAVLLHRAYPWSIAQTYGWPLTDSVMAEASW